MRLESFAVAPLASCLAGSGLARALLAGWCRLGVERFPPVVPPLGAVQGHPPLVIPGIAEPDVSLTDFGLALEAALFAYALERTRGGSPSRRRWFVSFFGAVAVASLTGGLDHGFFRHPPGIAHDVLWSTTLIAIGASSLALTGAAAGLRFSTPTARAISAVAAAGFAVYALAVLLGARRFAYAILVYLPATAFMLVVLAVAYRRERESRLAIGIAGLVLTFVAAAIQRAEVSLHPRYFNHNALYHVVQAVALWLFFASARWLIGQASAQGSLR